MYRARIGTYPAAVTRRMLTTGQAAQVAGVDPVTIRQWSSRGILHGYRVHDGKRVLKVYEEINVLRAEQQMRKGGGGSCARRKRRSQ